MNVHLKVQPHHLERGDYLYIRHSSMRQVVENVESARRQHRGSRRRGGDRYRHRRPSVIASSKHTDRNEVQGGLRQKHKASGL